MKFHYNFFSFFLILLLVFVGNAAIHIGVAKMTKTAGYDNEEPLMYGKFPDGFEWGAATASYQIEGGWDEGGKGLNIWDVFAMPGSGHIDDDLDGTVACDSYHKYKEDVQVSISSTLYTRFFVQNFVAKNYKAVILV